MAPSIRVLPADLADKIAAGEVVQRPASVVKELLENSIDAGARNITVVIRDSGKGLIQVVDDGSGMDPEDASIAFSRHATSKISTHADLDNIVTLGFRGEALAAIGAVSQVEMKTKRREAELGTLVRVEGGKLKLRERENCADGTSISVKNLFFNTPGRRKFLKADQTEFRHILDTFQRTALAHPGIAFTFLSEGEVILKCTGGDPGTRVHEIFGAKQSGRLIPFDAESAIGRIRGYLGRPEYSRKGRTDQYLFLNGRPIVNRSLNHAVYRAYEHLLEKGSFPFFILFLGVDPHHVDVNVHPSKNEVKFEDESLAYRSVAAAVRTALGAQDLGAEMSAVAPPDGRSSLRLKQTFPGKAGPSHGISLDFTEPGPGGGAPAASPVDGAGRYGVQSVSENLFGGMTGSPRPAPVREGGGQKMIWQIHDKYIITPTPEGVIIVDQHAAHERVLYERAIRRFDAAEAKSQQLLFPQTIEMTAADAALVRELTPLLESLGFVVKIFGNTTVILEGVPSDVRPGREATILTDVIDLYKEESSGVKLEPRERLAKSFSCRAAVKAGDRLGEAEMGALLEQLFQSEVPYVCPHGRPVVVRLSMSELDRRFGRTS